MKLPRKPHARCCSTRSARTCRSCCIWPQSLLSRLAAVSIAPHRHDLEVPGNDRIPRRKPSAASVSTCGLHTNPEEFGRNINPFDHGGTYTRIMKTDALKQALTAATTTSPSGRAARRGTLASEGAHLLNPGTGHAWDPKRQRPELWHLYNGQLAPGETMRVFPLSNWTELDVWTYIAAEGIEVVPLYFAALRPTVMRGGQFIVVDDERMRFRPGEETVDRMVRFRSLGCYPLSAAVLSDATDMDALLAEMRTTREFRTRRPADRSGPGRLDGTQEARGIFLMPEASCAF